MSDAKELLTEVVTKTFNRGPEDIASLFDEAGNPKEDAAQTLLGWHGETVSQLKEANKKAISNQRDRTIREIGTEWEKRLKGLGVDFGDAQGDDAIAKIREHMESLGKTTAVDPKDDASIRGSAAFRKREAELLKEKEELEKGWLQKWAERDSKDQREVTMRQVAQKADALFQEIGPVLSEDPVRAAKQRKLYEMDRDSYDYEIDGDSIVITYASGDKKGERVENAQGHPVKFEELIRSIVTSNYDIPLAQKKTSVGDPTKGSKQTGQGGGALKKPANDDEYAKALHAIDMDKGLDITEKSKLKGQLKELYKPVAA